jgi:hypothetical protein
MTEIRRDAMNLQAYEAAAGLRSSRRAVSESHGALSSRHRAVVHVSG